MKRLPKCKLFVSGCWREVAASLVDLKEAAAEDAGPHMTDVLFLDYELKRNKGSLGSPCCVSMSGSGRGSEVHGQPKVQPAAIQHHAVSVIGDFLVSDVVEASLDAGALVQGIDDTHIEEGIARRAFTHAGT